MQVMEKLKGKLRRRPKQLELEDYLEKLARKGLHPDGTPVLDPTPLAPPIGYKKHPSMVEIVRDMVRRERLAAEAEAAGMESFEEADDFDVGDEPEVMRSGWENDFDPPLVELVEAGRQVVTEREKAAVGTPPAPTETPPPEAAKPAQVP